MAKTEGAGAQPGSLWTGAKAVAALSLLAYAYSFGYLFRIEPQFISAFSLVDLILWAASSLIFLAIGILLTFAASAAGSIVASGATKRVRLPAKQAAPGEKPPEVTAKDRLIVLAVFYGAASLFMYATFPASRTVGWPLAAWSGLFFAVPALIIVSEVLKGKPIFGIRGEPLFYFVGSVLVFGALLAGDYQGFQVRAEQVEPRAWVCGDRESASCHPLVFLGSRKIVFHDGERYILRTLEQRHRIASNGSPPYQFPERRKPVTIKVGNTTTQVGF